MVMKRYYTSILRYRIVAVILPIVFIDNAVSFSTDITELDGIFGLLNIFSNVMFVVFGIFSLFHLYKIYKKEVYFEINETNMVLSYRKKTVYEYHDADSYLIKQAGKAKKLYIKSNDTGKKLLVPLNIFEVDYDEFLELLSKHSHKDIYIKDYGNVERLYSKKSDEDIFDY